MKTNLEHVQDFHKAFKCDINVEPNGDNLTLRWKLIEEETNELHKEFLNMKFNCHLKKKDPKVIANFTKELVDLLYVVYGTAVAYGLPINEAFEEVHKSNMSKLDKDGKPIFRDDGKVLKGPDYRPAQLEFLFV